MKPLTDKQERMLALAARNGGWEINGRGGFQTAKGLEVRGLAVVRVEGRHGDLVHVMHATKQGREYVLAKGLA